ncbi:D-alanyl-D-alanine carboxypeptidase precursor [Stieleria maiorica]|uniref:D-alanyl-D-alanine carboxypeptidase n=1 Tax=Stieleria maiorica TaxID=2795974 RepID=A0A5B9MN54_9BACT|nr:serine hydrolase domain-containing protein [Stieleria maiorica]QEG00986.1 D-alanyl-D-alanine carboxypeptidase precursor [Stieleria maiorica]
MVVLRVVLVGLMMCAGALGWAQEPAKIYFGDPDIEKAVDDYLTDTKVVGMGLAVVYDGEIVYLKGYGKEDREANIYVDPKATRFRWASISKTLTGILAVMADSDGIVDLDVNVPYYYPSYKVPYKYYVGGDLNNGQSVPESRRVITMRQLLSHTSGIQHYSNGLSRPEPPAWLAADPSTNPGMEWALKYWKYNPLLDLPGTRVSYSTPAFNLAGVVLEQKMGLSFDQLTQMLIAEPAGMTTLRPDTLWNPAPRRAVGYLLDGGEPTRDNRDDDVSWKLAGGGFISTVQDMGRFAIAILGNDILNPGEKADMWSPQPLRNGALTNRALGWRIRQGTASDVDFKVEHGGVQTKARCHLSLYPNRGLAVAVMTNSSTDCNTRGLAGEIEGIVIDRVDAGEDPIKQGYSKLDLIAEPLFPSIGLFRSVTTTYRAFSR